MKRCMNKNVLGLLTIMLVCTICGWAQTGNEFNRDDENSKAVKRMDDAAADLNRLTSAPGAGIPDTVLAGAKCVAIVPSLIKGGFVFGAEYGRGVASCRVDDRWSAPAFFTLAGAEWGAQSGDEDVDLVMLFMTRKGADQLMSDNWRIGSDVGMAAGPWGREGSVGTDWKVDMGVLTYSRAKGVFTGATLNGANLHVDEQAMRAVYGARNPSFRHTLSGKTPVPPDAHQFLAAIRQNFHEAAAAK